MFGQRPAFGASSAFGGFGTSTAPTGFGSSSFGKPVFGTPQTTAASTPFGTSTSTGTSLFGQNQPAGGSGGLFGSTTQSSGFGATGFGTTASSGGGLFGTNTQTSNAGLFGSNTSSFAAQNQARPFSFGTPTTSTGTALFASTNTGSSLFGSTMAQQNGTTIKYNPITGTDTMNRGGTSTNIQTKIEVISTMKEYETKSLEELRSEDYAAGRKGQAGGNAGFGFGQTKYTTSQPQAGLFGSGGTTTTSLFGQKPPENKGLFGTTTPSFGTATSGGGLFGSNSFGKPQADGFSFGATNQPKSGAFSFTPTTSTQPLFGAQSTSTPSTFGSTGFGFGTQVATQAGFGQAKPSFGNTGLPTAGTGIFGQKLAAGLGTSFGATTTASPFGATSTSTGLNLFNNQNQNKPNSGFSFGTNTSGFGSNTGSTFGTGSIFGQANQPKPGLSFGSSGGFGTSTSSGFGFGTNTNSTLFSGTPGGLFGNTGTGLNTGSNSFGSFGAGLGVAPLQSNTVNVNNNPAVNNNNINNLIKALTHNPFGNSSLLKSSTAPTGKADELLNCASGSAANNESSKPSLTKTPTYVLPSGRVNSSKPRPIGLNRVTNGSNGLDTGHQSLFAGLEDTNDMSSDDPFRPKSLPSVKKLNLRVFKNIKTEGQSMGTGVDNSPVSGSLGSAAPTSLTTPLSSLGVSETPNSLPPSHENSPTPDIIKGRVNIKSLNLPKKDFLNDTIAEFSGPTAPAQIGAVPPIPEISEANKENANISLFEASSIENIPKADNSSFIEAHPTAIKLRRKGYFTLPSLDQLSEMVDEEGKCLVENFTVGRYGYGNVCFPGITNVYGLDLDSIVIIVRKEIEVYPEGTEKPPKGEGLNKPAYVTLDCVWPVDKSTRDIVKTEERLASMGWSEYLEKQCLKMDATFIEYRPETGSWNFKVRHFSKYGLQDEDEPPAQNDTSKGAKPKETAPNRGILAAQLHAPSALDSDAALSKSASTHSSSPLTFPSKKAAGQHGPPAIGLTSPLSSFAPLAEKPMLGKKILENFAPETQDFVLDPEASIIADGMPLPVLSPSAERLTLASKVPHQALQTIKSQLFYGDYDLESEDMQLDESFNQQAKRWHFPGTGESHLKRPTEDDATSFKRDASVLSAKRLMLTSSQDSSLLSADLPEYVHANSREKSFSRAPLIIEPQLLPRESITNPIQQSDSSLMLRDARTSYQLVPSRKESDTEIERYTPQHLTAHLPLKSSLLSSTKNSTLDGAAFMSRSFRVGWGPGWTLVHSGNSLGSSDQSLGPSDDRNKSSPPPFLFFNATSTVKPSIVKGTERYKIKVEVCQAVKSTRGNQIDHLLESCLRNVLDLSLQELSNNGDQDMEVESASDEAAAMLQPRKGIDLLHRLARTASQVEDDEERDGSLSSILNLCVSLWGRLDFYNPAIDGKSAYVESQYRKEAFSQWLESVSEMDVEEEVRNVKMDGDKESYLSAVFSYLSARKIPEACNLAQDNGSHHLALLLAQTCLGSDNHRLMMQKQLQYWAEYGIDAFIPLEQLTLYALIAGLPTHQAANVFVNTCSGLNWRRALAIHLWYICPATATISEALRKYDEASGLINSDTEPYCQIPHPPYMLERPALVDCKLNHDICYHILKLYVDPTHSLDVLLENSSVTPDPLDFTTSWLIWCVLNSLNYKLMSANKVCSLHLNMASLLEAEGHWHWAAFVLLFITDEQRRKKEINDLLDRHLLVDGEEGETDPFYREKEQFLLSDLRLPSKWLYRSKSVRAKALKLIDEEAWYALKSGSYERAHTLIIESIAPNAIINEDHKYLRNYLKELEDEDIQSRVPEWVNGGGIYQDYLHLIAQVEEMKKSAQLTGMNVENLRPRLLGLCSKLNNLKCNTSIQRLSISEMSRVAVSVLRAILGDDPEATRVLAEQVSSLPLTHECALEELNLITHQYLTHVSMQT